MRLSAQTALLLTSRLLSAGRRSLALSHPLRAERLSCRHAVKVKAVSRKAPATGSLSFIYSPSATFVQSCSNAAIAAIAAPQPWPCRLVLAQDPHRPTRQDPAYPPPTSQ